MISPEYATKLWAFAFQAIPSAPSLLSIEQVTVIGLLLVAVIALSSGVFVVPRWSYNREKERNDRQEVQMDEMIVLLKGISETLKLGEERVRIKQEFDRLSNPRGNPQGRAREGG